MRDDSLASDRDEVVITVTFPNRPPVANAGLDAAGVVGESVELDAGQSAAGVEDTVKSSLN